MRIVVGSTNPAKVEAVREILQDYSHLKDAEVVGVKADSGVGDQPLTLDAITGGAINRAKNCFSECNYSVGIESGLMPVPGAKSGYMDICATALYDGSEIHLGLSSGFETPDLEIMRLVVEEGIEFDKAAHQVGLTDNKDIGDGEGISGLITKGRVNRKEFTKQALRMSLVHVDQ